jgi:hypothetical protein
MCRILIDPQISLTVGFSRTVVGMKTPLILNNQKAEIVRGLEDAGLSPTDFTWSETTSDYDSGGLSAKLSHAKEGYSFIVDRDSHGRWVVTRGKELSCHRDEQSSIAEAPATGRGQHSIH